MSDLSDADFDWQMTVQSAVDHWKRKCRENGCQYPKYHQDDEGDIRCQSCGRAYDI